MRHNRHAQEKELFLYAAEDATYATGNQAVFKASDFLGVTIVDANNIRFKFKPQDSILGTGSNVAPDSFQLTFTTDAHIEVLKGVASLMTNPHGGFAVVQDDLGTAFSTDGSSLGVAMTDIKYDNIASTGTAVAVTACTVATV